MWWVYSVLLTVLVLLVGFILYVFRKGYNKVKPAPLKDILCPPLTHSLLGHPDKMLHPLKHEWRLDVCESTRSAFHQLVMMKHSSVFINDAAEAGRLIKEMPSKGSIYGAFRYDVTVPDMLACDGEAWSVRRKALGPALSNIRISNEESITSALLTALEKASESAEALDLGALTTYIAFDCVCEAAFGYSLGAVAGSEEGKCLHLSLCSLVDAQASKGMYANPNARKVSPEELVKAQATWRNFLTKLLAVIRSDSEQFRAKNGVLDTERNFGHALIQLSVSEEAYGDAQLISEIHQVLRHGYETIAGTLSWMFYALYRHPKVRASLEKAILDHSPDASNPYPSYLERVTLETFRRYPVTGNMTVRSVNRPDFELVGGYPVPQTVPIHMHMWSLHNTARAWDKPREFNPDRWIEEDGLTAVTRAHPSTRPDASVPKGVPRCPFLSRQDEANSVSQPERIAKFDSTKNKDEAYSGLGHAEGSLSFFPFSAGERSCPAKTLGLQVIRKVMYDVAKTYRLDPFDTFWEEDLGASLNATVIPMLKKSTTVRVRKMKEPGNFAEAAAVERGGWAAEDSDEEKP